MTLKKMMVKHKDIVQGSTEWFDLKLKYPLTASEAQAIGSQGKGLETLCWDKMAEKESSAPRDSFTNKHLERGVELEPQAREIYSLETGNEVEIVGFITDESISKVGGASPDSLVNEDGLLEIKCYEDKKYFRAMKKGLEIESAYLWQMQMQMLFTGRKWCDFAVYNPNFKKSLLVQRVFPDPVMQQKIRTGLAMGEQIINEINK